MRDAPAIPATRRGKTLIPSDLIPRNIYREGYISGTATRPYSQSPEKHLGNLLIRPLRRNNAAKAIWQFGGSTMKLANQENYSAVTRSIVHALPAIEEIEVAELVFDSIFQGPLSDVRGATASARQLLYRSGSVCIDMHMEPTPGSDSVVLIGQLLDSKNPNRGMRDVSVCLLCDGDTVSQKKTNDVGEFDFGIEAMRCSQLVFGIGRQKALVVPVPDLKSAPEARVRI